MAAVKKYDCEWCSRSFATERGLLSHSCHIKRRWDSREDAVAKVGFRLYRDYYKKHIGIRGDKKIEDFIQSDTYSSFLRFAKYCRDTKVLDAPAFMAYLFDSRIPLHKWADDKYYIPWHNDYVMVEDWKHALDRTMKFVGIWSRKYKLPEGEFFRQTEANDLSYWIMIGSVSPWVYLNCESGKERLGELLDNPEYADRILQVLYPRHWEERFANCDSLELLQNELRGIGL